MARETSAQKKKVGRVMHEFKHGELKSHGRKVKSPKQAIAIGLNEAGASNRRKPATKHRRKAPATKRKARS